MSLNPLNTRARALDEQRFTWKQLAQKPISKLDDDAFTRVRNILMNGFDQPSPNGRLSCIGIQTPGAPPRSP